MTLTYHEVRVGLRRELESFEALLRRLDEETWVIPTRCEGRTVAAVSGHVVGQIADAIAGRLDRLGNPEATSRQIAERLGRTHIELADELASASLEAAPLLDTLGDLWCSAAPNGYGGTLGDGVIALWYDVWGHGDDIRIAIDEPSERGPGVRARVYHVAHVLTSQSWGPATLAFDGMEEVPVGRGGLLLTGDAYEFLLVATGRIGPAAIGLDETVNINRGSTAL